MHIASALGVPTVAVFGATDDTTTGPTGPLARVVREPVDCSPCLLRECPIDHRCMTARYSRASGAGGHPMDTRSKILSTASALEAACRVKREGRRLTVVTGYFDVLLVAQVRELKGARAPGGSGCLMVVLLPRAQPLLSQRARAEIAGWATHGRLCGNGE